MTTNPKPIQPIEDMASDTDGSPDHAPGLDSAIQGALGRKLRETYEEVVREDVPDKLLQLLDQLKSAEASGKPKASGD